MNTDFREIVGYAADAPSGHNTQPWKFRTENDTITLLPDREAILPIVDRTNRELYISLGCATENLCLAARHSGYETLFVACNAEKITVRLTKSPEMLQDRLFRQIKKRQTNRSIYDGNKIPVGILNRLRSVHKENQIRFHLVEAGTTLWDRLADYIDKGNKIQLNDPAFRNELLSWMRFNRKQVNARQDGLSYRVFGNPPLPGKIAAPIVRLFLKPYLQNRSDRKKIASSSHLVVFTTSCDTVESWIGLGRTLQRFLLQATGSGVACAFMNQPCEVPALAAALQNELHADTEYPALILRIGYAKPVPYAPRKKIEDLLI